MTRSTIVALLCTALLACQSKPSAPALNSSNEVEGGLSEAQSIDVVVDSAAESAVEAEASAAAACPEGMIQIPGGLTFMGTDYDVDEAPRFQAAVRTFCLDRTEVTVATYQACVQEGKCPASHKSVGCTAYAKQDLSKHPINCVDWEQADASCKAWGKRLPTEREWEFAASGGPEHRRFSWGSEDPEGRSCYNKPSTCPVGSFTAGAFGLHDMSGNVWEWTSSWFGNYPEEAASGRFKVYRGGSYSRRYPRWMRTGLRNRFGPTEFGAHLGFRCAADLAGSLCPEGSNPTDSGCEVPGQKRNGPRPPDYGAPPPSSGSGAPPPAEPPVVSRDPRYDEDCKKYKPGRPICYLVKGGGFADRQKISGSRGCVNRDVGVGFNSICCAQ